MHPRDLLKIHGLAASKERGQNFLIQPATAQAIVRSADIQPGEVAVEIGAGLGALTLAAASQARRVIAVELDRGVHAALEGILESSGVSNVELRHANALDIDWQAIADEAGAPVSVLGNLPYNISSQLLFRLIDARGTWRRATLMVQKEVAIRLMAGPGNRDYGRLSVLVQAWCELQPGNKVGPDQFFPRPKVASQVVHLAPLAEPLLGDVGPEQAAWFSRVVKAAFSQRRKTLANSLAGGLKRERPDMAAALEKAGIEPTRRAETLNPAEFALLSQNLTDA
jgi:16S rRNA (adenine1518-N6/adenine1519-N6)-dimethyltransferase